MYLAGWLESGVNAVSLVGRLALRHALYAASNLWATTSINPSAVVTAATSAQNPAETAIATCALLSGGLAPGHRYGHENALFFLSV
jgi:hypothetical protein